jgi:hypothetical protein
MIETIIVFVIATVIAIWLADIVYRVFLWGPLHKRWPHIYK